MTDTPDTPDRPHRSPEGDVEPDAPEPSSQFDLAASRPASAPAGVSPPASDPVGSPAWRLPPATLRATLFLVAVGVLGTLFTASPWRPSTSAPEAFEHNQRADHPLRTGYRVNLNRATADQLRLLPGVGPITAERIVEHRETHGLFSRVDELDAVHGIGPRTLMRLKPHVTVEPDPNDQRP